MQIISCDVCRKKLDSANGRYFAYFGEFTICEACRENLETQIKPTLRGKEPFSYEWYTKLVLDNLSKSVSKSR